MVNPSSIDNTSSTFGRRRAFRSVHVQPLSLLQRAVFFLLLVMSAMHTISPVADLLLAFKLVNLAFLLALIGLLLSRETGQPGYDLRFLRLIKYCFGALLFFCLVHAAIAPNSWAPDLRYFLLILIGYLMLIKLSLREKQGLFISLIWIFVAYFLYMIVVHGLFHAGWVELENWAAKDLSLLSEGNPIWLRDGYDFEYYFPFYSVVIARGAGAALDLGGFEFARLTGPFMEPTDVAFVIVPLLFYTWNVSRRNALYLVPFGIFSMMILWSFAASGLVAIACSILLYLVANRQFDSILKKMLRIVSAALIIAVFLVILISPDYLISLFGDHKLAQFFYFKEQFSLSKDLYLNPSAFGLGFDDDMSERTYGLFAVIVRHGWIGAMLLIVFLGSLVFSSWELLKTDRPTFGLMGFSTLVLLMKYSEIVNLYFLMIYVLVMHTFLANRNPVNRSKN